MSGAEGVELTAGEYMRYRNGGAFILDTPADPEPLWGEGTQVLMADGEALIIVGGQGVGKTTLAQQLALGRCGFTEHEELLGMPVVPNVWGKTLYLAMDRPRQAARSFRRMVGEAWREELNERLFIWDGPPLVDIARNPSVLRAMAEGVNAETIVVDSLKDAAIGLSDDEVGAGYNRARQMALAAGVQIIEVHHNRKAISGGKSASPGIDEVYGSTWLTSGAGSVLLLAGAPGDPVVAMHHLKQPASEVGPLKLIHDHTLGRTTVWEQVDLLAVVAASPQGLTKADAARALFDTDKPSAAQQEKARRRLKSLEDDGLIKLLDGGDAGSKRASVWGPMPTSGNFTRTSRGPSEDEAHDSLPMLTGEA